MKSRRGFQIMLRCAMSTSSSSAIPPPKFKHYHLSGTGKRSKCELTSRESGFQIITDTPKKMGGQNAGPQPVELLLASLIGCEQATAMFVARHIPIKIEKIDFQVDAVRDERGALTLPLGLDNTLPPARLTSITGRAIVYTDGTQEQIDQLEAEVIRRCPVANMVTLSGCILDIKWEKAA
jgi:putative redox protein